MQLNTINMLILLISVYLIVTFALTVMGIEKQAEVIKIFLISLLLTPIIGFVYLYGKKNRASQIRYYHCHDCDYIYPVKMKHCPICLENGVKVRLMKYKSPHSVADKIGELTLA